MFSDQIKGNCTTLINPSNTTIVFDVGWQAIPETIVFNLVLFFFFLFIFIILRRLAWDRKHVNIRRTSKGWLQSIYGDRKLITKSLIDNGSHPDASQYLLFQQYIIYFLAILSLFCILVILPVNLQGTEFDTTQGFARTTIINLPENSPFYWIHVIGASVISLVGIFMMHRFSRAIKLDEEQITRKTLLIRRIPKDKRTKQHIADYFNKAVPTSIIEGIQPVYNVRNLTPLTNELTNLVNARCYCVEYLELKGKRLKIRPASFGEFGCLCGCCECCRKVDGIEYYIKQEDDLKEKINAEMTKSLAHPTGGFFITFQDEKMAQEAFVHIRKKQEQVLAFCPFSNTLTQLTTWLQRMLNLSRNRQDEIEVARWLVSYAPYPDDINWCDITVNLRMQWVRSIVNNLLLFVLFVFISTPLVILNASDSLKLSNLIGWLRYFLPSEIGSKVPELVGPFILIIAASALPAIVTLACQYIAYVSTSAKNHAIMWKVYLFLVLMVIIWPSLGSASLKIFLIKMLNRGDFPWNCLFPVNIGSFFVNYTIQNAFIGNIMELLRLPELLIYLWYMATARSRAEVDTASRYVVWDFSIGVRYPRFLLIFAMVVTYSVSCPLITAAGLVYMIIKHLIDRYNIYYVYNPSKISSKIHSTAIMFVHIAFLMMQAQIFTVTLVRTGYSRVFGLAMFVFLVSMLVFSGHFFFYMFRNINHLTYRATRKQPESRREYCGCAYLPPVLCNGLQVCQASP